MDWLHHSQPKLRRVGFARTGGGMRGFVTGVLLTAALAASQASAQGLGDAAAREKKRRSDPGATANAAKPVQAVTTEHLDKYKSTDPPSVPAVQPPTAQTHSGDTSMNIVGAAIDKDPGESAKRRQAAEYKARLAQLEAAIDRAKANLASAEEWARNARRHVSGTSDRLTVENVVESAKRDLAVLQSQRDAIEDAARRADIPPGWLR